MSFWSKFGSIFNKLGSLAKEGLGYAANAGLTDDIIKLAVVWAKVAAKKAISNDQRREMVVDILIAKKVPESVARLAVELAVRIIKSRVD